MIEDTIEKLDLLDARIQGLSALIKARVEEQQQMIGYKYKINTYKYQFLNESIAFIFLNHPIFCIVIYTWIFLSLTNIFQYIELTHKQQQIIYGLILVISIIYLIFLLIYILEEIRKLILRKSKLSTMICHYLVTVGLYAIIYQCLDIIWPHSFNGIDINSRQGALQQVQLYLDYLYFSSIAEASVGFGDVAPVNIFPRIITFTQSIISVAFLSILFSNWCF